VEAPGAGSSVENVRAAKAVALRRPRGRATRAPRSAPPGASDAPAHEARRPLALMSWDHSPTVQ
jgi:hypothetical protein